MSSTRGRVERVGGVAIDAGASGRTDASQQTRPAFQVMSQYQSPTSKTAVGGFAVHPLFDFNSVSFWRFFWVAVALAYIGVFHVAVRRGAVSAGLGR